uniref:Pathogenesis-related protein 5-like n=1 Tax=Rhabditophanes sp. KR3021 TaxID=114890 RepID=A0AC35UF57_9BILA
MGSIFLCLSTLLLCASAVRIEITNHCDHTIWSGIQGSTLPENGGFQLNSGQSKSINVPDRWSAGRIWARTGCNNNMDCETGFCKNNVQCGGAGGRPPASLAEFTLGGHGNQDYYDVSLVDGYNRQTVGCNSACTKFNTDQYCCRGAFNAPQTCKSSTWPVNYPKYFKDQCPTAYSYAYDDEKSTFVCRGSGGRISPDYRVTFC